MFKHPIDARHEDWLCPRGAGRETSYLQVISQLAIENGPNKSLIYLLKIVIFIAMLVYQSATPWFLILFVCQILMP